MQFLDKYCFFLETLFVLNNNLHSSIKFTSMNEIYQKHLSKKVTFKGIGLHSGKAYKIDILPGEEIKELFLKE